MRTLTILTYQWKDLFRGKWIPGTGLLFLLITDALLRFGDAGSKALLSVSSIVLLFIPLAAIMYGALYLYQSREFVELLLAQPIPRKRMFWGLFGGLALPIALAFTLGAGLPMAWHGLMFSENAASVWLLLGIIITLTIIFTGLGFWLALAFFEDRIKGLGFALLIWLFLSILYDGLILLLVFAMGNFPLEKPTLAITLFNPVDLARILVLLHFEVSALMGYTGAVFSRFFGSMAGMYTTAGCLLLWMATPLYFSLRKFRKIDF